MMKDLIGHLLGRLSARGIVSRPKLGSDKPESAILIEEADGLRDAGRVAEAAGYYGRALALSPERADLAVQLGNMRKDSGDWAGAETAYRYALERRPDDADTWLQLGRALKLAGRRAEAEAPLRRAFAIDPTGDDAALELVALGFETDGPGNASDLRWKRMVSAQEMAVELTALRQRIDDVLARLPAIATLSAVPFHRYDILRQVQDLPAPPASPGGPIVLLVDAEAATAEAFVALLASLRAQRDERWHLVACVGSGMRAEAVARAAELDPRIVGLASGAPIPSKIAGGWKLHLAHSRFLHPEAVGWLIAARERLAQLGRPVAIYCDEEFGELDAASGQFVPKGIALGAGCDPLFEAVCPSAGRSLFVPPVLDAIADSVRGGTEELHTLRLQLAREGKLAYLPVPIVRRLGKTELPWVRSGDRGMHDDPPADRIDVMILSRDNPQDLVPFVDSLVRLASRPQDVSIHVVDHASVRPDTKAALESLAVRPNVHIQRSDAAFNWARLNAQAALGGTACLLVFANDDMRMSTARWDDALRRAFADPLVGVVGGRLLYPDGTIQHAGAIAGWRGSVANEGVGQPGSEAGPGGRWAAPRECAAVIGAFLATRRTLFTEIGGFDQVELPISLSDTDYCFKVRAQGYKVVYQPEIELVHHEGKTRGRDHEHPEKAARQQAELAVMRRRWGRGLDIDPSVHPLFLDEIEPFCLIRFPSAERLLDHLSLSADPSRWRLERVA
nr:tetratricopeptide repeat protein [Bosea robiniae]